MIVSSKIGKLRIFASTAVYKTFFVIPGNPTTPIFGIELKLMFRLNKPRFQRLMEDIMAADLFFYKKEKNRLPSQQSCLEAKQLFQLIDYFQMSQFHGRDCCFEFDKAIKFVYTKEYLRLPTKADLKSIVVFHRSHYSSSLIIISHSFNHLKHALVL
jgi:hypothetical protein